MEYIDKIVDFEYCKKCKYEKNAESEEPCHDCLNNPTNTSSIPVITSSIVPIKIDILLNTFIVYCFSLKLIYLE